MLAIHDAADGMLVKRDAGAAIGDATVWIDLFRPTREEDDLVETALGLSIPTREEMQEIEASSRLYTENGAHFMTAIVLHQKAGDGAQLMTDLTVATPVTFILAGHRLVTVRYEEPRSARAQKKDVACGSGCAVLVGLLDTIIDREADRVERITQEIDKLSYGIFSTTGGQATRTKRLDVAIKNIGREGELTSRSHECLHSLDRLLTYLTHVTSERGDEKALRSRIKTASRDIASLSHQVDSVSHKTQFLLDATLGMISIEQNNIIKIFSVASVALMPPTLIASIYGMNFKHMPELEHPYGYYYAIAGMVLSAILPFIYFRRKGWF